VTQSVSDVTVGGGEHISVEELSRRSGVPVRTVRFYQTKGLLPAPARAGREVRYDARHAERLRLINELQSRGLRLSAIAELLERAGDEHLSVPDWLGLGESLARPWIDDRPALLTEPELLDRLGGRSPAVVAALVAAGLVERRADTTPVTFLVASPALLDIGLGLFDAGIDFDTAVAARELLQARLGPLADELVAQITERVSLARLAAHGPGDVAELVERLRPLALRSVGVVFAHEMERALRDLLDAAADVSAGAGDPADASRPAR
jgi:DNA-binding transcriptional MerR regulator